MTPEERRAKARQMAQSMDWHSYDYTKAEGADMTFPDFKPGDPPRPVWLSKHYNSTSQMNVCHVADLNDIEQGILRRLMAVYGIPVAWDADHGEAELLERLENLDRAKATSPEIFAQWLDHYGLLNEEHMEWMRERVTGKAGALTNMIAQSMLDQKMEEQKQAHAQRAEAMRGEGGDLEPFMGVALESWAQAQAAITSGTPLAQILAGLGIDETTWQQVSAEWNARMARDTTTTIATVYGQAFTGAGAGQFGAAGQAAAAAMDPGGSVDGAQEPVPFERWIEITVAQEAGSQQGKDPTAVLAEFGITPADWGTIGAFWGQKFNSNAMAMMEDYNKWTAHFQQKYGVGHADGMTDDEREDAIVAEIIAMGKSGQAGNIIAFLKQKFPDDADDMDALDWWVDKACDKCGEDGDRATAQQLLPVRYQLQEDEDDPMDEWIASAMDMLF